MCMFYIYIHTHTENVKVDHKIYPTLLYLYYISKLIVVLGPYLQQ